MSDSGQSTAPNQAEAMVQPMVQTQPVASAAQTRVDAQYVQYAQPQYGAPPITAYPAAPKTNTMAVVAMVCSIFGIFFLIPSIVGVILGHISINQIKKSGENGHAFALTGLILGYVMIGLLVLSLVITALVVIAGIAVATL